MRKVLAILFSSLLARSAVGAPGDKLIDSPNLNKNMIFTLNIGGSPKPVLKLTPTTVEAPGAWTFGASGSASVHTTNGSIAVTQSDADPVATATNLLGLANTSTAATASSVISFVTDQGAGSNRRGRILFDKDGSNGGKFTLQVRDGAGSLFTDAIVASNLGAVTLGPVGSTQTHTVNGTLKNTKGAYQEVLSPDTTAIARASGSLDGGMGGGFAANATQVTITHNNNFALFATHDGGGNAALVFCPITGACAKLSDPSGIVQIGNTGTGIRVIKTTSAIVIKNCTGGAAGIGFNFIAGNLSSITDRSVTTCP